MQNDRIESDSKGAKTRYPFLKIMIYLFRLSAIVPVFFGFVAALTDVEGDSPGAMVLVVCAGGILGLLLLAFAELIKVFMDIASTNEQILRLMEKDK